MNPSTGTFITMDEYAGSIFEPVSLHKYLYANANPVTYCDPSGYSPLSDFATACVISSVLSGIITAGVTVLRFFFDDSFNLDTYGGNLALAIVDSLIKGAWNGFIFGGIGFIASQSILVSIALIGFCGYYAWESYYNANQKLQIGNTGGAIIDSSLGALSVLGAFSYSYNAGALFWQRYGNSLTAPKVYMTGKDGEAELARLYGGKSQKYFQTSMGGRFVDQFSKGIAHESKVGYTSLTKFVKSQILKDAELIKTGEINGAHWHFFKSGVTGKGGASKPLIDFLTENGIKYTIH